MDIVGYAELWEGTAPAGHGYGTRGSAVAISWDQSGVGLQTELISPRSHREAENHEKTN